MEITNFVNLVNGGISMSFGALLIISVGLNIYQLFTRNSISK